MTLPRYHPGEGQRCSGCGRSQWLVGRTLAECCFCGTALPLADSHQTGARMRALGNGGGKVGRAA